LYERREAKKGYFGNYYYTGTSEGLALFMAAAHIATRIKHQAGAVVIDEEAAKLATFVEADPTYKGHPLYAVING
jgi:hypothetical protein